MKKLIIILISVILVGVVFLGGVAFLGVERYVYNSYVTAIEENDVEKIALLEKFPYINLDRPGGEGWIFSFLVELSCDTPLETACAAGNLDVVEDLISRGADAGKTRDGYFTPIYHVLAEPHESDLEMLKLLIENGADPSGMTETSDLSDHSLQRISCRFVTTDQDPVDQMRFVAGPYEKEVANQSVEIYQYLQEKTGTEGLVDELGITTLMNAVALKNTALVEYLLENGSDVNQSDIRNETAIFYTVLPKDAIYDDAWRKEIFDLLVLHGADLAVKNIEGMTALDYAKQEGDELMVSLLQEAME